VSASLASYSRNSQFVRPDQIAFEAIANAALSRGASIILSIQIPHGPRRFPADWLLFARIAKRGSHRRDNRLMLSFGFPPISSASARAPILGSLARRWSLEHWEYYANPQNSFGGIIAAQVVYVFTL
jgi:hypothetical protein